jgi:hypothetical protein
LNLACVGVIEREDVVHRIARKPLSMDCIACAALKEAPQPHLWEFRGAPNRNGDIWHRGTLPCVEQSSESILV